MVSKDEICYIKYRRLLFILEQTLCVLVFYLFICYYQSMVGAIIYLISISLIEFCYNLLKKDINFLLARFFPGLVKLINEKSYFYFKYYFCRPLSKTRIFSYYTAYISVILLVLYIGSIFYGWNSNLESLYE